MKERKTKHMERSNLKNFIAPDSQTRQERNEKFRSVSGYLIIAIILLLVMFVIPIIAGGIYGDLGYYLPKSSLGWIVFWAIRLGTIVGNIATFILFKQQAKMNSRNNPNYLKAQELLNKQNGRKGFVPRSPHQMNRNEYVTKGISMVLFTAAESITIGFMVVNFDFVTLLSCGTSSITAVLFGWWTMVKNEVYWTEEYLLYAQYVEQQNPTIVEAKEQLTDKVIEQVEKEAENGL